MVEGTENSFHLNLIMDIFNKHELIKVMFQDCNLCEKVEYYLGANIIYI